MKTEGNIFAGIGVFLVPVIPVYWFWSEDPTGTTALIVTWGLCAMIGTYFLFTARRIDDRPEDDPMALIEDSAGELGFYSPWSWTPLGLAGTGAIVFLAPVFGWWILGIAVPAFAVATWAFVFEYYRGEHAH